MAQRPPSSRDQSPSRDKPAASKKPASGPAKKEASAKSKAVYQDDDLVIEDETAPKAKGASGKLAAGKSASGKDAAKAKRSVTKTDSATIKKSSSGSTKATTKDTGSKRRSTRVDDEEEEPKSRRKAPPVKKNNNDLVIYLLSGFGILFILAIGMIILKSKGGGPDPINPNNVLKEAKTLLEQAHGFKRQWNQADSSGNEPDRAKYLNLAKVCYEKVIAKVDELRKDPEYVEKGTEDFKKGYEFLEQFSGEAGQALGDILKRSKVSDSDH